MKEPIDDQEVAFQEKLKFMRELYLENHAKSELNFAVKEKKARWWEFFSSKEAQKLRLKRHMAQLEFKRCQKLMEHKSSKLIDKKIAIKKAIFKQKFGKD